MKRSLPLRLAFGTALLAGACVPLPASAYTDASFKAFVATLQADAVKAGVPSSVVAPALQGVKFLPQIIRLDRAQPETSQVITLASYVAARLTPDRIAEGRALYRQHRAILDRIAAESGVPAPYILALWGVETSFGQNKGSTDILSALTTLAYEGRRRDFFKKELLAYLQIKAAHHLPAVAAKGSWAGAMGHCQFMPTSYLKYARDGDGDGKVNIWTNLPDVFASIANYLKAEGWNGAVGWGYVAQVPADLRAQLTSDATTMPHHMWQKLGVTTESRMMVAPTTPLRLVQPEGQAGTALLVTENYPVIMHWNKSNKFAALVGQLADAIALPAFSSTRREP